MNHRIFRQTYLIPHGCRRPILRLITGSEHQAAPTPSWRPYSNDSRPRKSFRSRNFWLSGAVLAAAGAAAFYFSDDFGRGSRPKPAAALGTNPKANSTRSTLPLSSVDEPQHDVSAKNLAAARAEMTAIVGPEAITDRNDELDRHTSSEWSSYPSKPQDYPHFIVYPTTTEQVSQIMKICHRRRIPVVAFSGGTSLEGHFSNVCNGISIDVSRMDKILEVHKQDFDAFVQAGVTYTALNEALQADNLFFPPDPGPGAMIGGMIGTGCSGTNAYHYGTMREWVISVTVVLADGTIVKTRRRPRKSSAGYDLTKLFIGNEGTLGIVTEAVVKLTTKPAHERVAIAAFEDYQHACSTVIKIVDAGIKVAAVELLGDTMVAMMNATMNPDKPWREKPSLLLKFAGTETGVVDQMNVVKGIAQANGAGSVELTKSQEEAEDVWEARKQALFTFVGDKAPGEQAWITDVAVPMSRLADIVDITAKDIEAAGIKGMIVGHVGDGNFHAFILYSQEQKPIVEELVHHMVERAIDMDGTITGEHGVGLIKRDYLEREIGQTSVDLMRQVKKAFDPLCLLNCNKVVRMKPSSAGTDR